MFAESFWNNAKENRKIYYYFGVCKQCVEFAYLYTYMFIRRSVATACIFGVNAHLSAVRTLCTRCVGLWINDCTFRVWLVRMFECWQTIYVFDKHKRSQANCFMAVCSEPCMHLRNLYWARIAKLSARVKIQHILF